LIQEDLYPDEWMILVACLLLNQTQRKQVERVIREFVERWPTPAAFITSDAAHIATLVRPLGFVNRRVAYLKQMTQAFLEGGWSDARALPGCGEYAGRAHDIFCRGIVGSEEPNDHALVKYWRFLRSLGL
jgi:endonuclease III